MKTSKPQIHPLQINGKQDAFTLTRKSIKNINLRILRTGDIAVSAPFSAPFSRIEAFVHEQIPFICRARARWEHARECAPAPLRINTGTTVPIWGIPHVLSFEKGPKWGAKREGNRLYIALRSPNDSGARETAFLRFLEAEASAVLLPLTAAIAPRFFPCPKKTPAVVLRSMTSKWGICRPTKETVTLNRHLVYFPLPLAEYVIYHELAHFKHPNHSAAFWQHLAAFLPDFAERRRELHHCKIPQLAPLEKDSSQDF